jgi:hypothetical protein
VSVLVPQIYFGIIVCMKKTVGLVILALVISLPAFAMDAVKTAKKAIKKRDIATLNQLLDSGAIGPNDYVTKGETLLQYTLSQSYHSAYVPWKSDQDPDDVKPVVSALLAHHADSNIPYRNGEIIESPIFRAVRMDRFETALTLIDEGGANVNAVICTQDKHGNLSPHGTLLNFVTGDEFVAELKARGALSYDPSTMKCE